MLDSIHAARLLVLAARRAGTLQPLSVLAARSRETALHSAADHHAPKLSVALRYAFALGRKALKPNPLKNVEKAVKTVADALRDVLPKALLATYAAGGEVGAKRLVLRTAEFDESKHPRDERGQWTSEGGVGFHGTTESALHFILDEGIKPNLQGGKQNTLGSVAFISTQRTDAEEYAKNTKNGVVLEIHVPADEVANFKTQYGTVYTTDKTIPPSWIKAVYERKGERDKNGLEKFTKTRSLSASDKQVFFVVVQLSEKFRTAKRETKPTVTFEFNATDQAAVDWADRHAAELIDGISETTRDDINNAIADALEGEGIDHAIDEILSAVGDQDRAELIAHHEVMTAVHEGQRAAWDQAVDEGLLTGEEERAWIVTGDEKVCPICSGLEDKRARLGESYESDGQKYDGPPAHVRCRCTEGIVASRLAADFDEAKHPRDEHGRWVNGAGFNEDISDRYPIINEMRAYDERDAKRVRSQLRQKGRLNKDGTTSLYHVTLSDPESIEKRGPIPAFETAPGQDWQAEHSKVATYFFLSKEHAIDQAEQTETEAAVVEARIPITGETLSRFIPDEDFSSNIHDGVKVLVEGGAVAFIGGVPSSAVKIIHRRGLSA